VTDSRLAGRGSLTNPGISADPVARGDGAVGAEEDDGAVGVKDAEDQDLRL
jgi:hypothetical protein